MKRSLYSLLILIPIAAFTQSVQFAVVSPDGTTFICPTWDSAYTKSANGDIIYLPGTTINSNPVNINKEITVYGAGHYPDSTLATGETIFTGLLNITKKVNLEGFKCANINLSAPEGNNSSFIRLHTGLFNISGTTGIYICQCVFSGIGVFNLCGTYSDVFITNSIILGPLYNMTNSTVQNSIFLGTDGGIFHYPTPFSSANTIYKNNIFHGLYSIENIGGCFPVTGNHCQNNIFVFSSIAGGAGNFTGVNPDSIFINAPGYNSFSYGYNYHLISNSLYLNAGDDGTQIGLYGGNTPYKEGAVPANPHIYFKQVSTQTNSSGQLPVQFKVRANN